MKKEFNFNGVNQYVFLQGHPDKMPDLPTDPIVEFRIFIDSIKPLELHVGFHRCNYETLFTHGDSFNELAEKLEGEMLKVEYKGAVKNQLEKFIKYLKGELIHKSIEEDNGIITERMVEK